MYYLYLDVYISQCTGMGIKWTEVLLIHFIFFCQILAGYEVELPWFVSQDLGIIVAVLIWKDIVFQWGSVRSSIYKWSSIIFAVIIILINK